MGNVETKLLLFDYENIVNQVSDDELGIGTATRLLLIEEPDELEGTMKERNFFLC